MSNSISASASFAAAAALGLSAYAVGALHRGRQKFLIAGRTKDDLLAAMATVSPDIDVEIIPGPGHWIQNQTPEAFNAVLLRFLRTLENE